MLKRTPLHEIHLKLGARLVEFAGWEMPVQYTGPAQEHMSVREAAGLFDVSHMGEIEIQGPKTIEFLQSLTTNDVAKLSDNQLQYSILTNEKGGVLDDLLVYRINAEYFLLVVNAGTTETDFNWLKHHAASFGVELHNTSSAHALIALQGPKSELILQNLTDHVLDRIPYYWSQRVEVDGVSCRVSRTGYTGEDGFEIFCTPADAPHLWNRLLVTGRESGIVSCGLAARNTLRLEAAFRLYGHDMDETTTPIEAGLAWTVKLNKGNFIGKQVLDKQRREGVSRRLVGFEVEDRAPARDDYPIYINGAEAGKVSSGSPAPFLRKNLGLAYLPAGHNAAGSHFEIGVRGRQVPARVVETPFYKRGMKF
ncbi:MAG TPA: glycine cleavage system aminomethyltransferase GcvT [Blastocatellia bacterium]|nr:glycine cleavage system aminomethyltransferase GcvT [Blastocatellia bacterium]